MRASSAYLVTVAMNALWQVTLLGASAWAATRLMRRAPGVLLHRVWLATAVLCGLVPWLAAPWPQTPGAAPAGVNIDTLASWLWRRHWFVMMDPRVELALAGLIVVLTSARLLWIAWAYVVALRLRRTAWAELDSGLAPLVLRCEERLGLKGVAVRVSDEVAGPVTVGILRPTVILPTGLLARQGKEVTEAALSHEMAHVLRHDGAPKLCEELILLLVLWPPMASWLRRRLDHTRELAADEAAAGALAGGRRYSRSLVAIAAEVTGGPRPAAALCSMGEGSLQDRLEQLLKGSMRPSWWKLAVGAMAMGVSIWASAAAVLIPGSAPKVLKRTPFQTDWIAPRVGVPDAVTIGLAPPPPPPPPPPRAKPGTPPQLPGGLN
jgi:serine-type D-Ala-D-Ala endopeptidase (penicillin-binding protein 7)